MWGKPKDEWSVENDYAFQKELAAIAAEYGTKAADRELYKKEAEVRMMRK